MLDVEVIDDPAAAVALGPVRSRLLAALAQPASAATLAARLGVPRQKVNYHLRTLEAHGLVRVAGERRWGGSVEVNVLGTPEEVWQAIATGPGVSSWFVPTEVRGDGTIVSNFGPGKESVATRTAWDPPRRFAAESPGWGPGARRWRRSGPWRPAPAARASCVWSTAYSPPPTTGTPNSRGPRAAGRGPSRS